MTVDNKLKNKKPMPPSIYFGGCAFGSAFCKYIDISPFLFEFGHYSNHTIDIGVYQAMVECWGDDFYKKVMCSGGSAGTIFAIAVALGRPPAYTDILYRSVAEKSYRHGPIYYASIFLEESLYELLADPLAFKTLEGRCCFGTTEFFSKHRWHISWEDNADLIKTVQGSYHIPFYCRYVDGE